MSNYSAPPGHRIAYDRDGTTVLLLSTSLSSVTGPMAQADIESLNGDRIVNLWSSSGTGMALIFPQLMDLTAGLIGVYRSGSWYGSSQTSPDTTNGVDGTWTTWIGAKAGLNTANLRTSVVSKDALGVKGVRFTSNNTGGSVTSCGMQCFNVYGVPSSPSSGLSIWDTDQDQLVDAAFFDFGDVEQGSSSVKAFRVHNYSSTDAVDVEVSCEALHDTTPSVPAQFTFSTDGSTYTETVTISSVSAEATSDPVYVKRTTPSDAALSLWWARIVVEASGS